MTSPILLALGCLLAAGPCAIAQTAAPQAAAPGTANTAETQESFPVFAITSIEVLHSKTRPEISVVAVRGVATSDGWSEGELVPLGSGSPPDGVLDLVFVARPPDESAPPGGFMPIHAVLPLSYGHPFKAVRVRGATNSVLLRDLQATVETPPPAEVCKQCVGRQFVAKGQTPPTGVAPDQIVREDALPTGTRVIRATDGISDLRHNPDRLTILLGEDGRVVDAVWE